MGLVRIKIATLKGKQAKAVKYLYDKYDCALGFDERREGGELVIDITMDKFQHTKGVEVLEIKDVNIPRT